MEVFISSLPVFSFSQNHNNKIMVLSVNIGFRPIVSLTLKETEIEKKG